MPGERTTDLEKALDIKRMKPGLFWIRFMTLAEKKKKKKITKRFLKKFGHSNLLNVNIIYPSDGTGLNLGSPGTGIFSLQPLYYGFLHTCIHACVSTPANPISHSINLVC